MAKLPQGTREGQRKWSTEYLLKLVTETASLANSTKGYKPKWSVVTQILVSVYRGEIGKMRAIEAFNLREQTRPDRDDSPDVGDFD